MLAEDLDGAVDGHAGAEVHEVEGAAGGEGDGLLSAIQGEALAVGGGDRVVQLLG